MLIRLLILLGLQWSLVIYANADVTPETITRCKHATALVLAGDEDSGTAFYVGHGLFVTNYHVVEDIGDAKIRLVLDPGETTQKIVAATLLRKDGNLDLALLKTNESLMPPGLELGDTANLAETMAVIAFGYPFGKDLATQKNAYPSVTVSMGHITAFRKVDGALQRIQIDASLNPGNSGGPIVNNAGQVVGVVVEGILGTGVNFGIPGDHLRRFLYGPAMTLHAPPLQQSALNTPGIFTIDVGAKLIDVGNISISLTLFAQLQDIHEYKAVDAGGGRFTVTAPFVPANSHKLLDATVTEHGTTWILRVNDRAIQVGERSIPLHTIREITPGNQAKVILETGQQLTGTVKGLDDVETIKQGKPALIDLSSASHLSFAPVDLAVKEVHYEVTIRNKKGPVIRQSGTITARGVVPDILLAQQATEDAPAIPTEIEGNRYPQVVLANHPVAYFRLNERSGAVAHDLSPNRIDATIQGEVKNLVPGAIHNEKEGNLFFIGDSDILVSAHDALPLKMTGSFTVEAWFNQQDYSGTQCIFSKGNDQSPGYYRLVYNANNQCYQFNVKFEQSGTFGEDVLINRDAVSALQWHHMVGVYDAARAELRFYLDGRLAANLDVTGKTLVGNTGDFEIGAMPDVQDLPFRYFFHGAIGELAIYRSALSAGTIAEHYRLGTGDR